MKRLFATCKDHSRTKVEASQLSLGQRKTIAHELECSVRTLYLANNFQRDNPIKRGRQLCSIKRISEPKVDDHQISLGHDFHPVNIQTLTSVHEPLVLRLIYGRQGLPCCSRVPPNALLFHRPK